MEPLAVTATDKPLPLQTQLDTAFRRIADLESRVDLLFETFEPLAKMLHSLVKTLELLDLESEAAMPADESGPRRKLRYSVINPDATSACELSMSGEDDEVRFLEQLAEAGFSVLAVPCEPEGKSTMPAPLMAAICDDEGVMDFPVMPPILDALADECRQQRVAGVGVAPGGTSATAGGHVGFPRVVWLPSSDIWPFSKNGWGAGSPPDIPCPDPPEDRKHGDPYPVVDTGTRQIIHTGSKCGSCGYTGSWSSRRTPPPPSSATTAPCVIPYTHDAADTAAEAAERLGRRADD